MPTKQFTTKAKIRAITCPSKEVWINKEDLLLMLGRCEGEAAEAGDQLYAHNMRSIITALKEVGIPKLG